MSLRLSLCMGLNPVHHSPHKFLISPFISFDCGLVHSKLSISYTDSIGSHSVMRTPNLMGVLSKCHILIYYLLFFLSSSVVLVQFLYIISFLCTISSVNKVSNVRQIWIIFFCTRLEDFLERLIQVWWDTWLIYQFMLITSPMIISRCVSQERHQSKEQGIAQHTWSVISTRLPIVSEGHSVFISITLSYPVL